MSSDPTLPTSAPLRGKTILVTRTKAQSESITTQLECLGATVIHCPTIEIVPPTSWTQLDSAISCLHEYDWLVFTSSNAVRYFFARVSVSRTTESIGSGSQRVCAIGPATAAAI